MTAPPAEPFAVVVALGVPLEARFTERLPELTKRGDRHKTKGHRHHLAPCDVCGWPMMLGTARIGIACRMTPRCEGHHQRPAL